jgi:hypothetical protein
MDTSDGLPAPAPAARDRPGRFLPAGRPSTLKLSLAELEWADGALPFSRAAACRCVARLRASPSNSGQRTTPHPRLAGPGGREASMPACAWMASCAAAASVCAWPACRCRQRPPGQQAEYRARPAYRQRPPHRQPCRPAPLARHQPPARPGRPGRRAHLYPARAGTNACSSSPPKPMPVSTSRSATAAAATSRCARRQPVQGQLDPAPARRPGHRLRYRCESPGCGQLSGWQIRPRTSTRRRQG